MKSKEKTNFALLQKLLAYPFPAKKHGHYYNILTKKKVDFGEFPLKFPCGNSKAATICGLNL